MRWLMVFLASLVPVLLPWVVKQSRPTVEDGDPDLATRDKLRSRVKQNWIVLPLAVLLLTGCGVRTVYVPHGAPVRLRETVKDVKVWVKDADGEVVPGRMDLSEGWFCLPAPGDQ